MSARSMPKTTRQVTVYGPMGGGIDSCSLPDLTRLALYCKVQVVAKLLICGDFADTSSTELRERTEHFSPIEVSWLKKPLKCCREIEYSEDRQADRCETHKSFPEWQRLTTGANLMR